VNTFQRSFVGEIRRIDEMARRVRFFAAQIQKNNIPVRPLFDSVPLTTVGPRVQQIRDELDVKLTEHETRVLQMNESYETLSTRRRELIEARHVLRETSVFFDRVCAIDFILDLLLIYCRLRPVKLTFASPSTTALSRCSPLMTMRTSSRVETSNST
jgi:V-type ATPase 116kDa subunit family